MMSMQSRLKSLYEPFLQLECEVTHYRRQGHFPYMVWSEDGEVASFHADNHKQAQQLTGTVDYFTKKEFDQVADQIQDILDSEKIAWALESVQFEDETNLIHYSWRWTVV